MRVAVLCSGGDSPGMNAAIRGAVLRGVDVYGFEMVGFIDGWRGFFDSEYIALDRAAVRGISPLGGVFLGTSRFPPFVGKPGDEIDCEPIREQMRIHNLDGLLLIGGNGTQTVAGILSANGIQVIGLPKTIDNDLLGTDYSFGFDTAVSIAAEAIDRLRTTGESHRRCMVLEVMGRDAGWIALHAGMAGGAQIVLVPEHPETLDQICSWVKSVQQRGRSSLVVVAEGFRLANDEPDATLPNEAIRSGSDHTVAGQLAMRIESQTGIESRSTVLGHLQRGGSPTAFDRVLATRTGMAAADAVHTGSWGVMTALQGDEIVQVQLMTLIGETKYVPAARYEEMRLNFG